MGKDGGCPRKRQRQRAIAQLRRQAGWSSRELTSTITHTASATMTTKSDIDLRVTAMEDAMKEQMEEVVTLRARVGEQAEAIEDRDRELEAMEGDLVGLLQAATKEGTWTNSACEEIGRRVVERRRKKIKLSQTGRWEWKVSS